MMETLWKQLAKLNDGDGLTLRGYKPIKYKTGWQVAVEGSEHNTIIGAAKAIVAANGSCGVWYANGVYYIDRSRHIKTKAATLQLGRECNQISILGWRKMELVYC